MLALGAAVNLAVWLVYHVMQMLVFIARRWRGFSVIDFGGDFFTIGEKKTGYRLSGLKGLNGVLEKTHSVS